MAILLVAQRPTLIEVNPDKSHYKTTSFGKSIRKKNVGDMNESIAKRFYNIIGELVAVDNKSFSIMKIHVGFRRMMNNILPKYEKPRMNYYSENNLCLIKSSLAHFIQYKFVDMSN